MFGLNGRELRFAFVISVSHLSQHFLARIVPPLIPILAVALEYPLWQLGLLISVLSVGSGVAQAPIGVLSDRFDRKYILPTGIGIAGASYLLFSASTPLGTVLPSLTVLDYTFEGGFLVMCLSMLGVGIGGAVVHPTGFPLISANVRDYNKGKVLGVFGSFSKVGDAFAPIVIGLLILVLVWQEIVLLLGTVGILVATVLYLVLHGDTFETLPAGRSELDTESAPESAGGSVWERDNRTFLYPLTVIYVFFITKMFASKGLNTFVPAFLIGVYAYSFELQNVRFQPESVANFFFAILLFAAAASQIILGAVTDRHDPRPVMLGCLLVATVALLALALVDLSPILLVLTLIVLGSGLWGMHPARDALISEITPAEHEGRTFGYIWTAVHLTSAIIPAAVGYIIETVGYRAGFVFLSAGTVLAFLSITLLYLDAIYVPAEELNVVADANAYGQTDN